MRPCFTPGGRVAFGVKPEMCNNRKIGGKPAAPAPNENPAPAAPFQASEVDEREGQAETGVAIATKAPPEEATVANATDEESVTLVLPADTIGDIMGLLQDHAEVNISGGHFDTDYRAAEKCARILAELEAAWNAAS